MVLFRVVASSLGLYVAVRPEFAPKIGGFSPKFGIAGGGEAVRGSLDDDEHAAAALGAA